MATRSFLRLFQKTCSYSLPPSQPLSCGRRLLKPRSASQPRTPPPPPAFRRPFSRSLQNLRDGRRRADPELEVAAEEAERRRTLNLTDMSARAVAKEPPPPEEEPEPASLVYEVSDGCRASENFFDVYEYMTRANRERDFRLFPHLQPNNTKPFGSQENANLHGARPREVKITYPDRVAEEAELGAREEAASRARTADKGASLEVDRKRFSTSSLTARKCNPKLAKEARLPGLLLRKNSTFPAKRRAKPQAEDGRAETFIPKGDLLGRAYSTEECPPARREPGECGRFVTVKLRELQEECRRSKACKPKKISFGRLPKHVPPECACLQPPPLKEGRPLRRLKKVKVAEPKKACPVTTCEEAERADANYVVRPKRLRPIVPMDCPCVERELVDVTFRRLPKVQVPEPAKVCVEERCDAALRADQGLRVEQRRLPAFVPMVCPCVEEEIPSRMVKIKRLTMRSVPKEPERVCPVEVCDVPRADDGLLVQKKRLPEIKVADCPCVEQVLEDVPPLKRLVPKPVKEPPKVCAVERCDVTERADHGLVVEQRRLPRFVSRPCDCVEADVPSKLVKMKRLPKIEIPEKPKVCPVEVCDMPRADDGLVVQKKRLPEIKMADCPCVEEVLEDVPPLKRLVPKPVEEPPRICPVSTCEDTLRADRDLVLAQRKLPAFVPKLCPCVEEEVPSKLVKMKRLPKIDIPEKPKVCKVQVCDTPRADDGLVVQKRRLPEIKVAECPCVEQVLEDVPPLKRLVPKPVKEPAKVCAVERCDVTERADHGRPEATKKLPKFVPKTCPCVEPEMPSKTVKMRRLPKQKIAERPKVCKVQVCDIPRADDGLVVQKKRLPEIKASDCPCVEAEPPEEGRPLRRLPKKHVPEPPKKVCDADPCEEIPRADEDDWMYWKCVEVSTSPPEESGRRSFSTSAARCSGGRRMYSTGAATAAAEEGVLAWRKDGSDVAVEVKREEEGVFGAVTRFLSSYTTLFAKDDHLQPRKPIIAEREKFIEPFPQDDMIQKSRKRGSRYERKRREPKKEEECKEEEEKKKPDDGKVKMSCVEEAVEEKAPSLWQRVVNYFKARDCPSPEEFRTMRLREAAEKAAAKAGLCVCDPNELKKEDEKEMPKVITAADCKEQKK